MSEVQEEHVEGFDLGTVSKALFLLGGIFLMIFVSFYTLGTIAMQDAAWEGTWLAGGSRLFMPLGIAILAFGAGGVLLFIHHQLVRLEMAADALEEGPIE